MDKYYYIDYQFCYECENFCWDSITNKYFCDKEYCPWRDNEAFAWVPQEFKTFNHKVTAEIIEHLETEGYSIVPKKECSYKSFCDNYEIECYHCVNNYERLKNYMIYNYCGTPGLCCRDCNPRDCSYYEGKRDKKED